MRGRTLGVTDGPPVGGETPGGSANEVLESETHAGIKAWVCGRMTPGDGALEVGMCGPGTRRAGSVGREVGETRCPRGGPGGSSESVPASQEGRESWGGLESAIPVGGGGGGAGQEGPLDGLLGG